MEKIAFCTMPSERLKRGEIAEAELADMDSVCGGEVGRIGRKIPRLHFESTHLNQVKISHSGDFGLVLRHTTTCAKLLDFFFTRVRSIMLWVRSFGGSGSILNVDKIKFGVIAFRGTSDDFGGDNGDGVVTAGAVFLAPYQGRPHCFGCIAGGGS